MSVVEFDLEVVARALYISGVESVEIGGNIVAQIPKEMFAMSLPVDATIGWNVAPTIFFCLLFGEEYRNQAIRLMRKGTKIEVKKVGGNGR